MDLFKKKKRVIEVGGQKIELEPKPSVGGLFQKKPAAQKPGAPQQPQPTKITIQSKAQGAKKPNPFGGLFKKKREEEPIIKVETKIPQQHITQIELPKVGTAEAARREVGSAGVVGKKSPLGNYLQKTIAKQKGLEVALREAGIETSVEAFAQRMFLAAAMLSIIIAITVYLLLSTIGLTLIENLLIALVLGISIFQGSFRVFLTYPKSKTQGTAKNIERDILFAARDLIISLRSGMPLFNALTLISTGYGDASKEFKKVVARVEPGGLPLEEAIDETVAESKSQSFRRIMLQASVSIKAGADVVGALQSVIDQLSQERVIELRRYGQRLNALAMFYMLFGVIMPSMGIAVVTILTTFIALFSVDNTVLISVLIGIIFMQVIFLKLITASRPVFAM